MRALQRLLAPQDCSGPRGRVAGSHRQLWMMLTSFCSSLWYHTVSFTWPRGPIGASEGLWKDGEDGV